MKWTVALATLVSIPLAPWRVSAGIALGGLLSLLNYYWLTSSITAAFTNGASQVKPRLGVARYVFRYLVVGLTVFSASALNLVSLPASIAGLCSIVVPFMIEALVQFYYAIVYRED
jgi:hypothetical protein